jgi:hypothetical protein
MLVLLRGGFGSNPLLFMCGLWWTKWHWGRLFFEYFNFPAPPKKHHHYKCPLNIWSRVGGCAWRIDGFWYDWIYWPYTHHSELQAITALSLFPHFRIYRYTHNCLTSSLYGLGTDPTENTASSIAACWLTTAEKRLSHRCVATSAALTTENNALLFLRSFASAGNFLPSRCLAMNSSGCQASCHNIIIFVIRGWYSGHMVAQSEGSQAYPIPVTNIIIGVMWSAPTFLVCV